MRGRSWNPRAARIGFLLLILAISWGCSGVSGDADRRVQEVVQARMDLMSALERLDATALAPLIDSKQEIVIFHPRLTTRFDGVEEIRAGLQRMSQRLAPAEWTEAHRDLEVVGDIAWHTSSIAMESEGMDEPLLARATEIWIRRPEGWKLVHAHWSEDPESRSP